MLYSQSLNFANWILIVTCVTRTGHFDGHSIAWAALIVTSLLRGRREEGEKGLHVLDKNWQPLYMHS